MEDRKLVFAIGAGCCLLTLVFLLVGFPYDRLESRVVRGIEDATGARLQFAASEQGFGITGPSYEWHDVRITGLAARPLDLDRLSGRMAWSFSWFRLAPAFRMELDGSVGHADGVVTLGSRPGFDGHLEAFDLGSLPPQWQVGGFDLRARANADVDIAGGEQWIGDVSLEASEGNLSGGKFRNGLPFSTLTGTLHFAGDHRTEITALHIEGPLLKADLTGSIGPAESPGAAPLDLALDLDADVRATALLRGFGIRISKQGAQSFKVSGTVDNPQVR